MLYRQVRQAPPPLQGCWEMRGGCAPLWVSPQAWLGPPRGGAWGGKRVTPLFSSQAASQVQRDDKCESVLESNEINSKNKLSK